MDISWWAIVISSDSPAIDDDDWCNKNASYLPAPGDLVRVGVCGDPPRPDGGLPNALLVEAMTSPDARAPR
jgi:hypothetical protein